MLSRTRNCIVCGQANNLHRHHIFYGRANRQNSEKYDLTCWLCVEHHEGMSGVHGKYGENLNAALKKMGQIEFEKTHSREEFIEIFGRNYID